ncbi:MAG: hypothetical protein ACI8X5_003666 [Planctomycetota bacterium]|jgi:hypothetical protein
MILILLAVIAPAFSAGPISSNHCSLAKAHSEDSKAESFEEAEYENVPTTGVSIRIPDGFSASAKTPGFFDPRTGSAVNVRTMSDSCERIVAGLTDPKFLERGSLKLVSRETLTQGEVKGELLQVERPGAEKGQELRQWMWIFGDEHETAIVTGTCLVGRTEEDQELIRLATLSAIWTKDLPGPTLEELPFELSDTADLKFAGTNLYQAIYSSDGNREDSESVFRCGPMSVLCSVDRESFVEGQMKSLRGYKSVRPGSLRPTTIDGLPGFVCKVQAHHTKSGQEHIVYRVVLFEGVLPYSIVGAGPIEKRGALMNKFKAMSQSFKRHVDVLKSESEGIQLEVPATWNIRDGLNAEAVLQAAHSKGGSSLIVMSEAKSDFDPGYSLESFSADTRSGLEEGSLEKSEPQQTLCGSLQAIRCQYTLDLAGTPAVFVHVAVEGKNSYYQLIFWTDPTLFEGLKADFERAQASFEELKK